MIHSSFSFLFGRKNYHNWRKKVPKDFRVVPPRARHSPDTPTFAEFARFVARGEIDRDVHIMGYQDKCDVCNLPYNFIGKVETLEIDDRFVVDAVGISDNVVRN